MNRLFGDGHLTKRHLAYAAGAAMLALAFGNAIVGRAAETAHAVPPFTGTEPAPAGTTEVAVFAGGCFWGVQGVFQHVKGVTSAVSGYAGGEQRTAQYETVSSGRTGHAESVRITFDPKEVSYAKLLQIYFSVAHNPTELNRQGPDVGTQYRSTIFPTSAAQAQTAKAYIAQINSAHVFKKPLATTIEPDKAFYPAEAYHQDFMTRHPNHPYIMINDAPKVSELKRMFGDAYRPDPVLVANAKNPS
ncbi:MAG: peptide-methionine (S)-S-oxide reductase MsrA [Variibacter sp.]